MQDNLFDASTRRALAVFLWLAAPAAACAQQGGAAPATGATKAAAPLAILSPVQPSFSFTSAQYATAGVPLRNRRIGAIQITGVAAPVKRALLYWAYLFGPTAPPPASQAITFCNTAGSSALEPSCRAVTGTKIATGSDVCWGSSGIAVYRANVTNYVRASGLYQVVLSGAQSAVGNGSDPWGERVVFPAAEGASLVVVGAGTRKVAIYDAGLAGQSFRGAVTYSLALPGGVSSTPMLWDSIVADGQTGNGRIAGLARETTYINNIKIGGPGANLDQGVTDGDFDGSAGWPLPQLWDVTGHALKLPVVPLGATTLPVKVTSSGTSVDCLSPIANVTAY
ncbi:hypothetical protein LG047_08075 [Methylocystis sp. WRRC1]|uniref:hypothetical protein n=1 Tax=Methylocystis sp. WRRC1 TaxID=1732014 RepID=UPI001D153199|nr:hypothetical protein [Methylocystis sp. WRRC1]MCC3245278.1 hypothetical protein [Methylocystis sp. WRRC1]